MAILQVTPGFLTCTLGGSDGLIDQFQRTIENVSSPEEELSKIQRVFNMVGRQT